MKGATVAIVARTLEPDPKYVGSLRETCEEISASGGTAIAVQADLSISEDRERLFAEVVDQVGPPDILVNNAAVTFLRPLDEFPERRARLMVEMHVIAPLRLTQLSLPAMRERKRGWVVNLTSVGGDLPSGPPFSEFDRSAGFGVYGTVKAALNRLTISLAAELYDGRHRRERGRAVESRGHARRGHVRPGQDRHRRHRTHHGDGAHPLHV